MNELPKFRSTQEARDREFYKTLKRRVDAHFEAQHKSSHGDLRMAFKALFWIGNSLAAWVTLLGSGVHGPLLFVVWAWLGFSLACVGFNVGHDAIHGAMSADQRINRLFSWSYELIGANVRNWFIAHNVLHHTWTNVPGIDQDIEPGAKLRFHMYAPYKPYHRWQHLFAWPLYGFLTLNWVTVYDFQLMFWKDPKTGRGPTALDSAKLLFGKVCHFGALLAAPLLVLDVPWWQTVLGFVLMHAVGGFTLATTFQLAHVIEGPEFLPPDANGDLTSSWAVHQLRTTANFQPGNRLMTFIVGGLNHQVEHHLFPRICHVHYPDIAPIVEATAKEFGLPYHCWPTMPAAIAAHYRHMRMLADPASVLTAPVAVPVPA